MKMIKVTQKTENYRDDSVEAKIYINIDRIATMYEDVDNDNETIIELDNDTVIDHVIEPIDSILDRIFDAEEY